MFITFHGQSFDLRFEENIQCLPDLLRKLAAEALQEAAPARDGSPQPSNLAPLTVTSHRRAS